MLKKKEAKHKHKVQKTTYLPVTVAEHYQQIADDLNRSFNEVISYVLKKYMEEDLIEKEEEGRVVGNE